MSLKWHIKYWLEQKAKPKVNWVCEECGSDNIHHESYAYWNVHTQDWDYELCNYSTPGYCCDGCDSVSLKEVEISDGSLFARRLLQFYQTIFN